MAIWGCTGKPDHSILDSLQQLLQHRGATQDAGNVGGHFVDSYTVTDKPPSRPVTVAWSGTIRSGTDDLARDYARDGIRFANELRGEFVLLVCDGQELYLVRDPAGARTAYFGRHGRHWVVAAEPKGIWGLPGFSRRLRPAAVAQYFTYSFIPGTDTMLEDLWEVPPGHYVHLRDNQPPTIQRYFDFPLAPEQADDSVEVWASEFRTTLEQHIAERLLEVDRPAIFLSGGLDSSIITAEVARQYKGTAKTFSIHFGRKYPNELAFARDVARHCGTENEEVEITSSMVAKNLPKIVWHLDDPIGDPVTAPNFLLASHAAGQGYSKVFNGEGGDPLFGGPKNLTMLMSHWYGGVGNDPRFRQRRYLESYRRGFEELSHVLTPRFQEGIDEVRDLHSPLDRFFAAEGPFLHKLLAINTQLKGAHLILPKVERMLAASGLVPLSPLFTDAMIRLAFRSPPQVKLNCGREKWLMKEAYRSLLPSQIVDRPKSGMRVPVHYWFKGPLRRYAKRLLNRRAIERQGIFEWSRVERWMQYDLEHPQGRYGLRVWMLLTFELWRRIVIEGERFDGMS